MVKQSGQGFEPAAGELLHGQPCGACLASACGMRMDHSISAGAVLHIDSHDLAQRAVQADTAKGKDEGAQQEAQELLHADRRAANAQAHNCCRCARCWLRAYSSLCRVRYRPLHEQHAGFTSCRGRLAGNLHVRRQHIPSWAAAGLLQRIRFPAARLACT